MASTTTPRTGRGAGRRPGRARHPGRPRWYTIALLLLPALLLYAVFVLYPIVQSMRYSLFDWNGFGPLENFVGFDNFARALASGEFRAAVGHVAFLIVASLVVQLPFALGLALLLNSKIKGRALLRTVFFAPYVLSEVVTGVVWRQILRPDGLLDQSLQAVGGESLIQGWLSDPDIVLASLFFIISWKYFGLHMVLMLAGLQGIPKDLMEAASIDGASAWESFRYVTLPLLGPTIRVSAFLSVIGSLQTFDIVWVTTKGGPIGASSTMATFLYDQFRRSLFGFASAVSIIIFILCLVVALFYQRLVLRQDVEGVGAGA